MIKYGIVEDKSEIREYLIDCIDSDEKLKILERV